MWMALLPVLCEDSGDLSKKTVITQRLLAFAN
jgi:hypothetical protein